MEDKKKIMAEIKIGKHSAFCKEHLERKKMTKEQTPREAGIRFYFSKKIENITQKTIGETIDIALAELQKQHEEDIRRIVKRWQDMADKKNKEIE